VFEDDTIAGLPADHLNEPLQHLLAGRKRAVAYFFYKDRRHTDELTPEPSAAIQGGLLTRFGGERSRSEGWLASSAPDLRGLGYGLAPLSDV